MDNVGIIDTFLNTFTTYIDSGFGLLNGEIAFLSSTLIALDITLAGLFWAWGADEDIIQRLVKKTQSIGFFAFVIGNFNGLAKILFNSFAGLGLLAGGSSINTTEFLRPGRLAQVGLDAGQPLLDAASALVGPVAIFTNAIQIAVLMVSWLIVLVAFFILAVQLFVTLIEFKLTTLAGFVLVPFALFNKTAFLAEKVLGNIVASGIKVMVLAVIVGIGTGLFSQFTTSYGTNQPTIEQTLSVVLAALALLGLGIFGPGIATGLVSGAPQLGAGAAVGTGLAVAGAAVGAGAALAGGGAALAGAGRATAAAARGVAHAAGAASSAYGLASAGQSGMAGVASGLGGIGKAAGGAMAAPVRQAAKGAADSLKERFQAGARSAFTATGGSSTMGSTTEPANSNAPGQTSSPPDWAKRMRRNQAMNHGISAVAHAVRSGDSAGGGHSVDLSERGH
ncbi:P-type conjugative transfer protein TrbL [Magnetospirillum sp. 64-120]|uniref:P-type conjugative transfer protein TrbL n=1 Tax=Magnetospirillum sp. 64-120 TaxID=1895778 RepID=UPI00092C1311|nr:P-type conjugative transfer protein TrbL [Magnetospirillum sp. 64-120]OJX78584.1 MAG: P-type conjugative transfer protein TrbL [Magnetospirillum sp. 64-120]